MTRVASRNILFYARFILYLSAVSVPLVHPSISIHYDRPGWFLWFILIPAQMIVAYHFMTPRVGIWIQAALCSVLLVATFSVGILNGVSSLPLLLGGLAAFISTIFMFKSKGHGRIFAAAELVFISFYYFRFLGYTRASETAAQAGSAITEIILFVALASILAYSLIVYMVCCREHINRRNSKEFLVFTVVILVLGLTMPLFVSPDFISHIPVLNQLADPLRPELIPLDESVDSDRGGGTLRSDRGDTTDDKRGAVQEGGRANESGGMNSGNDSSLAGIQSDKWDNRMQDGRDGKQYAVMVVASKTEPVYAAEAYYAGFHPQKGFIRSGNDNMEMLASYRLIDTWKNSNPSQDAKRLPVEIFYLSTIPERVLAYEPETIQPTILDQRYHPFDYSYLTESAISISDEQDWRAIGGLNDEERRDLDSFLQIRLPEDYSNAFTAYLGDVLDAEEDYYRKIQLILGSFSDFQYQIGFNEDVSVKRMAEFLFEGREGDCTEFSNSTAILARLAGIPARVVTGYLASSDLQLDVHRRGLRILRQSIEPLSKYPVDELYLVTTAHHHSWVQFYMPGFGWVDFETTSSAKPPVGADRLESMQLVIPIIQPAAELPQEFRFPWLLLARILGLLAGSVLVTAYALRYITELHLLLHSRAKDIRGLDARYRLLLMRFAAEGCSLKRPSQTIFEYAGDCPAVSSFADFYSLLRFREHFLPGEKEAVWKSMSQSYSQVLCLARRPGLNGAIKRVFSLRGLHYL